MGNNHSPELVSAQRTFSVAQLAALQQHSTNTLATNFSRLVKAAFETAEAIRSVLLAAGAASARCIMAPPSPALSFKLTRMKSNDSGLASVHVRLWITVKRKKKCSLGGWPQNLQEVHCPKTCHTHRRPPPSPHGSSNRKWVKWSKERAGSGKKPRPQQEVGGGGVETSFKA